MSFTSIDSILKSLSSISNEIPCAILIRHGHRPESSDMLPGIEVKLTEAGRIAARRLGEKLQETDLRFFSSPFERCVQTAQEIAHGARNSVEVEFSSLLGMHGPFVLDPSKASLEIRRLRDQFFDIWMNGGIDEDIMRTPENGTQLLVKWILRRLKERSKGIDVHISHDIIVTAVVTCLVKYDYNKHGLLRFLDGCVLWKCNGKLYVTYSGVTLSTNLVE